MKRFIVELGVVPSALDPLVIYCDNMGAITNAQEPRSHKRLKHIKLRYHSIREYIEDGEVKICKVHTDLNVADPLTKALPRAKHDQHQNAMGVRKFFVFYATNPYNIGEERPPPRRNDRNEEEIFGKLKFTMPKFHGEEDPDAYLSWVLKVDKIFRIHNFSEAKKVAMASLEFEGYANVWWEEVNKKRDKEDLDPIATWEEMQEVMHKRFVPNHHKRDLFNMLTQLKQSYKSVEEYYKEMHMTMMSANVDEREEQTMARFLNGLNIPVKRIVEFLPYTNMVELLHQATRAERQVREDIASAKTKSFFAARNATNTSSSIKNTSAIAPKDPPKQTKSAFKTTSFKPDQSTMSSKASMGLLARS
ncbi:hypothetical protein QYE76_020804 [Lolium multiflorum]|uniref:Retrotransposon gag domain-containing protein n=1 Tax=Lolium multiflorum TaxID=4521 RepID=A0AAD8VPL4_LOLMU|nr:hypothetical protein QYE76_020804 [Lolium multiflorum]